MSEGSTFLSHKNQSSDYTIETKDKKASIFDRVKQMKRLVILFTSIVSIISLSQERLDIIFQTINPFKFQAINK